MTTAPSPIAAVGARVRARRTAAGLTLAELARRAAVARATLTQLEAGAGNPTLETLYALANTLGVPLSDLIGEPAAPPVRVVRAEEMPLIRGEALEGRLLERIELGAHVLELFATRLLPGAVQSSGPHPPGTREHLLVQSGRARVGPVGEAVELGPGDLVVFDATRPHAYAALGTEPAEVALLIVSPAP
jgi:transcriptional regulator with XRE-family HTH domain